MSWHNYASSAQQPGVTHRTRTTQHATLRVQHTTHHAHAKVGQQNLMTHKSANTVNPPHSTNVQKTTTYNVRTFLPGEISTLVDPGASISMAGHKAVEAWVRQATQNGFKISQDKMAQPPRQGLRQGSPSAHWQAKIKRAVPCADNTRLMEFTSPSVAGTGSGLPILYGLGNMERHKAV